MSENAIYAIAAGIVMTISTITPAIAQGITSKTAMEAIARQPESTGDIRSNMIVIAALIEGVALLALAICLLAVLK